MGATLLSGGSYGSGNGQFVLPSGVAVDSSGNVYVTDADNNRVRKFDSYGRYLTQLGSKGSGPGQFLGPFGIALDSSDNVYVTDSGNNRVEKFTSNGTYPD
jgi:DNA-binding beta-propeller fold protein YncE